MLAAAAAAAVAATAAASEADEETGGEEEEEEEEFDAARGDGLVKKKKKKKALAIRINLASCKYEVLRIVQRKMGWKEVGDSEDWEVYWTDTSVSIDRIIKLNKVQKINHFNGMLELCRKRLMAKNLQKMYKLYPEHYSFFPRTYVLPSDQNDFLADLRARGKRQFYILKPDAGCQGRGIRLVQGGKEEKVLKMLSEMDPNVVAQHYLHKPHLIHGYKYDMRIYTLVLSCDPLRVFVFKEGLARICTEKYAAPKSTNISVSYMHLTNYALNKHNDSFVPNDGDNSIDEAASKWSFAQLAEYITGCGHNWDGVWLSIQECIMKSIISVQPVLKNNYRSALPPDNDGFSCFELLGYDVMLDSDLQPWLIEVNHSASFNIESPLDLTIKSELITDTLNLVRVDPKLIQRAKKQEKLCAAARLGLNPNPKKPAIFDDRDSGGGAAFESTGGVAGGAAGSTGGVGVSGGGLPPDWKPKTAEEYETWRASIIKKREQYEAKNSGGYTRIYPSEDPQLQALYEELLRGANEIYNSAFVRQTRKPQDSMSEERRKKEDQETDSVKEHKARQKAHRDRLAQQHIQRRQAKEMAGPSLVPAGAVGTYYSYGGVYSAGGTYGGASSPMQQQLGQSIAPGMASQVFCASGQGNPGLMQHRSTHVQYDSESNTHQGSDDWGESDAGSDYEYWSPMGSRPLSARSGFGTLPPPPLHIQPAEGSMPSHFIYETQHHSINSAGQAHHPQPGAGASAGSAAGVTSLNSNGGSLTAPPYVYQRATSSASSRREGAAGGVPSSGYSTINLGALPPSPFRGVLYPAPGQGVAAWEQQRTSPSSPRNRGQREALSQPPHTVAASAAASGPGTDLLSRVSSTQQRPQLRFSAAEHTPGAPQPAAVFQQHQPSAGAEGGLNARIYVVEPNLTETGSPRSRHLCSETAAAVHWGGEQPAPVPWGEHQQRGLGGAGAGGTPVGAVNSWSRFIQPPCGVAAGAEPHGFANGSGNRSIVPSVVQSPRLIDKFQQPSPRGRPEQPETVGPGASALPTPISIRQQPVQAAPQPTTFPSTTAGATAVAAGASAVQQHPNDSDLPHAAAGFGAAAADPAPASVAAAVTTARNNPSPTYTDQVTNLEGAANPHPDLQVSQFHSPPTSAQQARHVATPVPFSRSSSPFVPNQDGRAPRLHQSKNFTYPSAPQNTPQNTPRGDREGGPGGVQGGYAQSEVLSMQGLQGGYAQMEVPPMVLTSCNKRVPCVYKRLAGAPPSSALSVTPVASLAASAGGSGTTARRVSSANPCFPARGVASAGGPRGAVTSGSGRGPLSGAPSSITKASSMGSSNSSSKMSVSVPSLVEDGGPGPHESGDELAVKRAAGGAMPAHRCSSGSLSPAKVLSGLGGLAPSPGASNVGPPGFFVRAVSNPSVVAGGKPVPSVPSGTSMLYSAVQHRPSTCPPSWAGPRGGGNPGVARASDVTTMAVASFVSIARSSASTGTASARRAAVLKASKRTAVPLQSHNYLSVQAMRVPMKEER